MNKDRKAIELQVAPFEKLPCISLEDLRRTKRLAIPVHGEHLRALPRMLELTGLAVHLEHEKTYLFQGGLYIVFKVLDTLKDTNLY